MIIKNASFIKSISDINGYTSFCATVKAKEICVVGRSNVGKSSFINMMAARNKLAKTSSTPGRTRLINLFSFNDGEFILTDLPGYGYAAAAKTEKDKWGKLIESYLQTSERIARALVLVDIRHDPSPLDRQMIDYLYYYNIPFSVIATKADKLSKSRVGVAVQKIATGLAIGRDDVIPVSAVSGKGKEDVLALLDRILSADNSDGESA